MKKNEYVEKIKNIFGKYRLSGSLLECSYIEGANTEDFTICYVDSRIKNSDKIKKELHNVLDNYFNDYPTATQPLYAY
jgi:hypothetical protein